MDTHEDMSAQEIDELQKLLERQENDLISLRDERNRTIRKLHQAKLDITKPSAEILKIAARQGPMDDVVFNKIGMDLAAISEIISTILGVQVKALNTTPQYTISNIGSMGVRLDNYSEVVIETEMLEDSEYFGKKGTLIDIEVQGEKDDLEYRAFYNGASMIINKTPPRTPYSEIARAIVIVISSYDPYGKGKMLYENIDADSKTKKRRRSPLARFFVNTKNLDKFAKSRNQRMKKVSALMKVFRDPDWYDDQFPAFSEKKRQIHETPEGVLDVSKELQLIIDGINENAERRLEEAERRSQEAERRSQEAERRSQEAERRSQEAERESQEAKRESQDAKIEIQRLEEEKISSMKAIRAKMNWSAQETLAMFDIPSDLQAKYAAII